MFGCPNYRAALCNQKPISSQFTINYSQFIIFQGVAMLRVIVSVIITLWEWRMAVGGRYGARNHNAFGGVSTAPYSPNVNAGAYF